MVGKIGSGAGLGGYKSVTQTYTSVGNRSAPGRRAFFPIFAMPTQLNRKRAPETPSIPDRLYFKIGDVAKICEVETYVLRFWESQFPQLKPNKSGTGQRLYRRRDVEMVLDIKRLVHGEGYTISGARQALEQTHHRRDSKLKLAASNSDQGKLRDSVGAAIGHARAELREIMGLLGAPAAPQPRRRTRVAQFAAASGSLFPS
jgi:DNA-binding transcriptional MerR regulator